MVCKALRGRNIIISSRARNAFELRGPYDIINFASLLGLQEADAKVWHLAFEYSMSDKYLTLQKNGRLTGAGIISWRVLAFQCL